jgi:outer membrane protein OmpA-like peptidoglycan-associated protein
LLLVVLGLPRRLSLAGRTTLPDWQPTRNELQRAGAIGMNANLLSLAQEAIGGDFSKLAAQYLGESSEATQSAMSSLLPVVFGSIAQKGATQQGASGLMSLIQGANLDVSSLGNTAKLFANGAAGVGDLVKLGSNSLVPAVLGERSSAVASTLSSTSGIRSSSATALIAMSVPMLLTFLKKFIAEKGLNAASLASMLSGQGASLQRVLDSRLTTAMGFASPAAFASGLAGRAADTAKQAGAAVAGGAAAATTTMGRSRLLRWLPWLIAAVVLLLLWSMLSGRWLKMPAPVDVVAQSASAPVAKVSPSTEVKSAEPSGTAISMSSNVPPVVPNPLPAPGAGAGADLEKIYFAMGSAAVDASSRSKVLALADVVKRDQLKVAVTGYTDKSGSPSKNEVLARRREASVKAALVAAGVPEASIELRPSTPVTIGSGGHDAEARRVEITKQ